MSRAETLRDLRQEARRIEADKRDLDRQLEAIHIVIRRYEAPQNVGAGSASTVEIRDAIYGILSDEHPLHRRVILERLIERGVHIGGVTPINSLSAHLSTDDRFSSVEETKGTWTLTEFHSVSPVQPARHQIRSLTEQATTNEFAEDLYRFSQRAPN